LRADFFGMMLGLPAVGAVAAAVPLNRLRAVRYEDEELRVLDRDKLLPLACECYEEQHRVVPLPA
jgi:hypothetical protein